MNSHKCDVKFLQKRSDDNEKTIKSRIETYKEKTLPILNFYKKQNLLYEVNGMAKIDDISKEIRDIITTIET
jgi:adenylate kinase